MADNQRYELHVWNSRTGYDGEEEGFFETLKEAKSAFDKRVVEAACNFAAVYDRPDCKKALWTFPSYWDGHDHTHGRGFDPKLWVGEHSDSLGAIVSGAGKAKGK